MHTNDPERMAHAVIAACADCDICRFLMEDTPCPVFPELYRLYDKEKEKGEPATRRELKNLVELCNFCALCPCPNIRRDIMKAKHAFVNRDGIKLTVRFLEDVECVSKLCGAYPRLANTLFQSESAGRLLKKLAGIHEERKIPVFPGEDFASRARKEGLHIMRGSQKRKVAFFAGCTGQYLFPDVPAAGVRVLQRNGIEVYFPEQKCCGMPSLLEGDRRLTLEFASFNMDRLSEAVEAGYDIVCSCPTCGYMLKNVLSEGAYYSVEHRESAGRIGSDAGRRDWAAASGRTNPAFFTRSIMDRFFKDEGYFASISAVKRIEVASHTYDLGEYLRNLHLAGEFNCNLGPAPSRMVYYPPCHLREQKIGEPYWDLLKLMPDFSAEKIDGAFYCCGIAGIMGFKRDFHEVSVSMGSRLMEEIRAIHPETLVSDCLSCRIQFNQMLPYTVRHPIEILDESYANAGG